MAVLVSEPVDNNPMTDDWQRILFRTTFQGGGYIQLFLNELNTSEEATIALGSRLEVNGNFYSINTDESINDPDEVADENWVFVYAVPQTNSLRFDYGTVIPEWSVEKCGWYDGMNRAVAKMYKRTDGFWGKVILENYERLYLENANVLPDSGGELVAEGLIEEEFVYNAKRGMYRYELLGGAGGRGGAGYGNNYPAEPLPPLEHTGSFFLVNDREICLRAGQGGGDGGNGNENKSVSGSYTRTGGGSGATGGCSLIFCDNAICTLAHGALGTSGTNGTGAQNINTAGGVSPPYTMQMTQKSYWLQPYTNGPGGAFHSISRFQQSAIDVSGGAGGAADPARNGYARLYLIFRGLEVTPRLM